MTSKRRPALSAFGNEVLDLRSKFIVHYGYDEENVESEELQSCGLCRGALQNQLCAASRAPARHSQTLPAT